MKATHNSANAAWVRALKKTEAVTRHPTTTLPILIDSLAEKFETAPALIYGRETVSYRGLAELSGRYTLWALSQKLSFGDVVCLLMRNRPEFLAIWLGITRVGCTVALINTHLVGFSLAHCINTVRPKQIIVGAEFAERLAELGQHLPSTVKVWTYGESEQKFSHIDIEAENAGGEVLKSTDCRSPTIADRALYIYTSGATGLPKAASVSHFRLMQWSYWFAGMMDTSADDRMFNCLPMYHSVGGVVAIGAVLVNGGSVILRETFSARHFWDDIVEGHCTLFQYIGELCRYLLNSPSHPRETEHELRLCCGNGLSAGVWERFKQRFRIPRILEFYAATEGTFSLYNCEGKPGSVGRVPSYLAHLFPMALVRFDAGSGLPQRDERGLCIRCAPDEIGEAIGRVAQNKAGSSGRFEGYSDEAASERKLLHNVFSSGDVWFRTGDLMRQDRYGYFYFVDRVGDTFRWKGENVSTTELENLISRFPGVIQAVAYGVTIPNTEGRAGMATAIVDEDFDLAAFRGYLVDKVAGYAIPRFLRLTNSLPVTGTFKLQKQNLIFEAYDPSATADPIYFNDEIREAFVRIDSDLYERIIGGKVRI